MVDGRVNGKWRENAQGPDRSERSERTWSLERKSERGVKANVFKMS